MYRNHNTEFETIGQFNMPKLPTLIIYFAFKKKPLKSSSRKPNHQTREHLHFFWHLMSDLEFVFKFSAKWQK